MVPVHSPEVSFGRKIFFCSARAVGMQRLVRAMRQAGVHRPRLVAAVHHLVEALVQRDRQALATVFRITRQRRPAPVDVDVLYASLKPFGRRDLVRRLVELAAFLESPLWFSGKITPEANLPPSSSTALIVSASTSACRGKRLELVGDRSALRAGRTACRGAAGCIGALSRSSWNESEWKVEAESRSATRGERASLGSMLERRGRCGVGRRDERVREHPLEADGGRARRCQDCGGNGRRGATRGSGRGSRTSPARARYRPRDGLRRRRAGSSE